MVDEGELRRIWSGPSADERAFLVRVVFEAEDPEAVLAVARKTLAAVLGRVESWPEDDDVWTEVVPAEFIERCASEDLEPGEGAGLDASEENARWMAWWRALTPEEKRAACEGPWRLSDWLYCFDPTADGGGNDRSWWWWDAGIEASGAGWIDVATTGWPFGTGSLYWLIEASGGRDPHS
ncbi:hypothetical protein D0T12_05680 [Actinomadura spongiicola]|uniref:Uncharacterized protein n=1 Tax=Actinomadura spongiicola TaxID=2303421 RepID=A0A372GL60_9ACTN|nr:hypothetical protein [Actinomadura spongiicola]RFS86117.1 hypothetical protein D0T12_05680 [Actinomadura spongiicola]